MMIRSIIYKNIAVFLKQCRVFDPDEGDFFECPDCGFLEESAIELFNHLAWHEENTEVEELETIA